MSLSINFNEQDKKKIPKLDASACHAMPCHIHFSGSCNTAAYLTPTVEEGNGKDCLKSSFRGHPLLGQKVNIPTGYKGFIVKEGLSHGENRQLNVVSSFPGFTAWNYDQMPSRNDIFVKTTDWIDVAHAIHKKVKTSN